VNWVLLIVALKIKWWIAFFVIVLLLSFCNTRPVYHERKTSAEVVLPTTISPVRKAVRISKCETALRPKINSYLEGDTSLENEILRLSETSECEVTLKGKLMFAFEVKDRTFLKQRKN
jgi:hypothetical protein